MNLTSFLPMFLIVVFWLAILFAIFYLINKWVNAIISLRRQQNDLLREIIKKLDFKE
jgi:hypothetical protein